jgi:hypothetical protein
MPYAFAFSAGIASTTSSGISKPREIAVLHARLARERLATSASQ